MAAPPELTNTSFTGNFVMNKNLSDSTDKILELQGMGWWMRKMIGLATITLHVKHYKDDAGLEHIDIKQTLTGGIEGNEEDRTLDWVERSVDDTIFGHVISKTNRLKADEIQNEYLRNGWLPESFEPSGAVHSYVISDTPKSGRQWTAEQIWGFEEINGERRYVRHVYFTAGKETILAKLIYDYVGKYTE